MKQLPYILIYVSLQILMYTCIDNNTNITLNNFNLTAFKLKNNNNVFKSYLIENNNTEMLYTEFSFEDYATSGDISNLFKSNYKVNVYWFSNYTVSDFSNGLFYGIGHTKIYDNSTFTDLAICIVNYPIYKCEDYYLNINNTNNLEQELLTNFNPILDIRNNDFDSIFYYDAKDIITNQISPYNILISYQIVLPFYSNEKSDLNFDFMNNMTIFYGKLGEIDSTTMVQGDKLNYQVF